MKVFCYFVEPALYTLDLAKNIYVKNNIDYGFINSNTLVKSEEKTAKIFLDNLTFFSKLKFLITTYKNNDFIIVNGYNNYPFIVTFILNLFSFNRKYIATDSDTQFVIPNNPLKRFVKWLYLSVIFQNKYVLGFAGGSNSHKELFRCYGMKEDRIFLMPMMVDSKKFYCDNKVYPKPFTFLYVGRLIKHKNIEALIQQFNINFSDKDAVLKIVGGGEQGEYLIDKYASEKVIFMGKKFNQELISEYLRASCFVCSSLFEPWGLVVNEALSAGLPVIASKNVGACFDLIKDKKTGFIAEDMQDFGQIMLTLFSEKELLKRYSKNASDLMKNNWNYDLYNICLNKAIKKVKNGNVN
jgi:glycosyltransferase involved in cell wall biosynthesis